MDNTNEVGYLNGPRGLEKKDAYDCILLADAVHVVHSGNNHILGRLIGNIDQWGRDRQLVREHGCTAIAQFKKLREEIGEWEAAILRGDEIEMVDGAGDALTVIIQILRLTEVPMIEALERAYSQIRYRKGKMIDGIFVKEEK